MSNMTKFLAVAMTAISAQGAFAADMFGGTSVSDEVSDLQTAIEEDAAVSTFGNEARTVGTYGSVALRGTSSNSTTSDTVTTVGIGAQYGFYDGTNGTELNLSYAYSKTGAVVDTDKLSASYDYTRDLGDTFFAYGNASLKWDRTAALATDTARDAFIGFGAGYRILDTKQAQMTVQAGPGYRFLEDGVGAQTTEAAASAALNVRYNISDTVYLSDTFELVGSASDVTAQNEIAVNVALSNALSLRTSYASTISGADFGSMANTANTMGVSVVYNFN